MATKPQGTQAPERRSPKQMRSQLKVELMLEAASLLLDAGGFEALTTNAVAARAGVSIGTLYQYFHDKNALLDALVERELGGMSAKVMEAVKARPVVQRGDRIRGIVRAVVGAYGGRGRVHRLLMEYTLTRMQGGRLSPLYRGMVDLFTASGVAIPGESPRKVTAAQAFVLVYAIVGVLRTLVASSETPPLREVEDALVELVVGYVSSIGPVPS